MLDAENQVKTYCKLCYIKKTYKQPPKAEEVMFGEQQNVISNFQLTYSASYNVKRDRLGLELPQFKRNKRVVCIGQLDSER